MSKRFVLVPTMILAGASALASVGVMVDGAAAHGITACVNVKGTQRFSAQTTTFPATCDNSGTGNVSVAVGNGTSSSASGTNNTAVVVGHFGDATAGNDNHKDKAVAVGSSSSTAFGNQSSAVAVNCLANTNADKQVSHCP